MNSRSRWENSAKWAAIGGFTGAVAGGGVATLLYRLIHTPTDFYAPKVIDLCVNAKCNYDLGNFSRLPTCWCPEYCNMSNACIKMDLNDHCYDDCKESELNQKIIPIYESAVKESTLEFMWKYAAPIGFGIGATIGALYGYCKTPTSDVPRVSAVGLFSGSDRASDSKQIPLLEEVKINVIEISGP